MKKDKPIDIRISDSTGNVSYLTIKEGSIRLRTKDLIPLSLSNITDNAAELTFALRNVSMGLSAIKILRSRISAHYKATLL